MMRLIDADKILDNLSGMLKSMDDYDAVRKVVNNMPTAYDVDAVVEQLKDARDGYLAAQHMTATNDELIKRFIAKEKAMNLAIEIVKGGGVDAETNS